MFVRVFVRVFLDARVRGHWLQASGMGLEGAVAEAGTTKSNTPLTKVHVKQDVEDTRGYDWRNKD